MHGKVMWKLEAHHVKTKVTSFKIIYLEDEIEDDEIIQVGVPREE